LGVLGGVWLCWGQIGGGNNGGRKLSEGGVTTKNSEALRTKTRQNSGDETRRRKQIGVHRQMGWKEKWGSEKEFGDHKQKRISMENRIVFLFSSKGRMVRKGEESKSQSFMGVGGREHTRGLRLMV